ncbi:MAG: hypothetical protein ACHQD9_03905, partial [Chitinophagales bacterium]
DMDNLLSKMNQTKSDMQNYDANSSHMSDQEKQTAREHINTEMGDLKQMHQAASSKYGKGGNGQNGNKSQEQHQKAAPEKAPAQQQQKSEAKPANQHQTKEKSTSAENSANPK